MLALAELHAGPRRGIRVGIQVEDLVAVEPVHVDVLIHQPGGDGHVLGGLPQHGHATPEAAAVVDVVVPFAGDPQGVDEPAVSRAVAHHAHGRVVAQGRVEGRFDVTAGCAAVDGVEVELRPHVLDAELRLVGDVPHGAADGAGSEQRALRAPQGFHALDVIEVKVRGEQRDRDRRVVQIDADLFLDTRLVAHDLPG